MTGALDGLTEGEHLSILRSVNGGIQLQVSLSPRISFSISSRARSAPMNFRTSFQVQPPGGSDPLASSLSSSRLIASISRMISGITASLD